MTNTPDLSDAAHWPLAATPVDGRMQADPVVKPLDALRHLILDALTTVAEEGYCLNLYGLEARTDLPRETLRGIVADMRKDGLVSYHKGLWAEDGMPAGAGYAITAAGRAALVQPAKEGE